MEKKNALVKESSNRRAGGGQRKVLSPTAPSTAFQAYMPLLFGQFGIISSKNLRWGILPRGGKSQENEMHAGMIHVSTPVLTIALLLCANLFMTFAWYGHLKYPTASLWLVILFSWGIAFFEYCLQVPANRYGYTYFSAAELKTIQEVLSLTVFMFFSVLYLGEPLKWNYVLGFAMIVAAAFIIFYEW